jgi:hypothetical protein
MGSNTNITTSTIDQVVGGSVGCFNFGVITKVSVPVTINTLCHSKLIFINFDDRLTLRNICS